MYQSNNARQPCHRAKEINWRLCVMESHCGPIFILNITEKMYHKPDIFNFPSIFGNKPFWPISNKDDCHLLITSLTTYLLYWYLIRNLTFLEARCKWFYLLGIFTILYYKNKWTLRPFTLKWLFNRQNWYIV